MVGRSMGRRVLVEEGNKRGRFRMDPSENSSEQRPTTTLRCLLLRRKVRSLGSAFEVGASLGQFASYQTSRSTLVRSHAKTSLQLLEL